MSALVRGDVLGDAKAENPPYPEYYSKFRSF